MRHWVRHFISLIVCIFFRPLYGQRCLSISWNWVTTMKLTVQWSAIQTHRGKQLMFKYNQLTEKHLFESLMIILHVMHNQCIITFSILCSFCGVQEEGLSTTAAGDLVWARRPSDIGRIPLHRSSRWGEFFLTLKFSLSVYIFSMLYYFKLLYSVNEVKVYM